MPIRSLYLFRQNLSNILDLIFYQPDADPPDTKPHNLFLLSIVMKLLLCNVFISLVKDALYSTSSWLFRSKASIKMYPKFKLNFSENSISKWITKIVHSSAFFVKYCGILTGGFEGNSAFLVSTYSIFYFYILFTICDILGWFWVLVINHCVMFWSNYSCATCSAICED